ncbi:MAG: C_GCAxxG_C_C family protein [Dehalococcoidales bacterium]|nr:C_GCAxxG_C_C family protein [Dehalococcoidales bacterium]
MWEAYGLVNEDFLWAGTAFHGGIAGQQRAPCGAISAAAIALGLRHRCSPDEKEKAKAGRKAAIADTAELVGSFNEKFGDISCLGLMGVELTDEKARKRAIESGLFEKCDKYVEFVVEKLYELEEKRSSPETGT